jgi:glycosyltransferase involved in cell wall biosynthesis
MLVSVIIPTYNRADSLCETLDSLAKQTFPADRFEVIVVDDGSTTGTKVISDDDFNFPMRYIRQENQGGVSARNHGANKACNDLLIFLDDDMTLMPGYISALSNAHQDMSHLVSRGKILKTRDGVNHFNHLYTHSEQSESTALGNFSSNNLSILRKDFFALGGWKQVVPDHAKHKGGLWADLEFAYRAVQNGFVLKTTEDARIYHRDYAAKDLKSTSQRACMVSHLAVSVLQNYPELWQYTPMFFDKAPIVWEQDTPRLVVNKLARQAGSTRPFIWSIEKIVRLLEIHNPNPTLLRPLYRWVIGGYIYRGFRKGLFEFGSLHIFDS